MVKAIALLVVIALTSASAHWGFRQPHNQWNGLDFHHPQGHWHGPPRGGHPHRPHIPPWTNQRPEHNHNGYWPSSNSPTNNPNPVTISTTPTCTTPTSTTPTATTPTSTTSTTPSTTTGSYQTTTESIQFVACINRCSITTKYNPVCGTDGLTYINSQHLGCAYRCGRKVSTDHNGQC